MPLTVPVKVGVAKRAFASSAPCIALEIGLLVYDVLSTLPRPTMDFVIAATVPVKVGLAKGAFVSRAPCVALDIGLLVSAVLSILPRPTIALVMPLTVPTKIRSNLSVLYS